MPDGYGWFDSHISSRYCVDLSIKDFVLYFFYYHHHYHNRSSTKNFRQAWKNTYTGMSDFHTSSITVHLPNRRKTFCTIMIMCAIWSISSFQELEEFVDGSGEHGVVVFTLVRYLIPSDGLCLSKLQTTR